MAKTSPPKAGGGRGFVVRGQKGPSAVGPPATRLERILEKWPSLQSMGREVGRRENNWEIISQFSDTIQPWPISSAHGQDGPPPAPRGWWDKEGAEGEA